MNTKTFRAAPAVLWAVLGASCGAAWAHGDAGHAASEKGPHAASRPAYDASVVEQQAFGREGDPRKVVRTIRLSMSDAMRFSPDTLTVRRGDTVRLVVANGGKLLHELVLGTEQELKQHAEMMKKHPDMEHQEPHMVHVRPGARGDIVWQFNKAGVYRFACLIPGHFEAGMVGKVVVK